MIRSDKTNAEPKTTERGLKMQRKREMDLREVEQIMEESEDGGVTEKKESLISIGGENPTEAEPVDSSSALQLFLDRIPISSIPGINNYSSVLELKSGDCLGDAIRLLYKKNVFGAPIVDDAFDGKDNRRLLDRYIGFIDFARLFLWSLEECEKASSIHTKGKSCNGFFSMLEELNPHVAQTKISELAKSFLWDPFFPVHLDETLFHVLMLLSKHRLQFVPVTEQSSCSAKVIGFVTQNAVIQLLLQSSGLHWFDCIADKALSEFRFEHHAVFVHGDQSIAEAMHVLWENQMGAIAVIERETKRIIGSVRNSDLRLLLDNDDLFNNRKSVTVEKFIRMDGRKADSDPTVEPNLGAFLSAGVLTLSNKYLLPRMDSPVTNKKTDTLKQAMNNVAAAKCNFCFLVDDLQRMQGVITSRDMIIQFSPPSTDSTIDGAGFFDFALEQTGCHIEGGTMIHDHS